MWRYIQLGRGYDSLDDVSAWCAFRIRRGLERSLRPGRGRIHRQGEQRVHIRLRPFDVGR
jgi:hypothetical protein